MEDQNKIAIGNPSSALLFMFSAEVFITWGIYQNIFEGDVYLVYGIILLASFPMYILGGYMLAKRNEDFLANLYFIFGVLFGGMMGMSYIALFFGYQFGLNLSENMLSIPLIIGGIGALITMIPYRFASWVPFLTWSIACIWLITSGIEIYGIHSLFTVNKYLGFLVGIGVAYLMVHELLLTLGVKGLPQGAPIFKQ